MKSNYEYITYLQYQCHNQEERIRSLESGAEYRKMEKRLSRLQGYYERQLKKKDRQIESLHRQLVHVREIWFQVFLDIQKECDRRIKDMNHILEKKEQLITEQKKTIKDQKNKISQKIREVTEERAKTNDEKEKNQKLQAQVDRNFKNSSTPSSQDPFRGKVTNNREKSGRKEGGQPGHEGHRRKVLPVTEAPVFIDAPSEIKDNPDYYKVKGEKGVVHKQVIGVHLNVTVTDYYADVYRNRKTGARYHAPFPEGISLEVNYDESVKALVFLLRNHLNVSILYKAMVDYKESVLCFLTNPEVDFSNNEAERCARKIKRHTVMSGSFRGRTNSGADHYCSSMSVMETDRRSGYNIFVKTKEYFKRNVVIRPGKDRDINPEVQLP